MSETALYRFLNLKRMLLTSKIVQFDTIILVRIARLGLASPLLRLTKKHQTGGATCVKQKIDSVTAPQQLS